MDRPKRRGRPEWNGTPWEGAVLHKGTCPSFWGGVIALFDWVFMVGLLLDRPRPLRLSSVPYPRHQHSHWWHRAPHAAAIRCGELAPTGVYFDKLAGPTQETNSQAMSALSKQTVRRLEAQKYTIWGGISSSRQQFVGPDRVDCPLCRTAMRAFPRGFNSFSRNKKPGSCCCNDSLVCVWNSPTSLPELKTAETWHTFVFRTTNTPPARLALRNGLLPMKSWKVSSTLEPNFLLLSCSWQSKSFPINTQDRFFHISHPSR